WGMTHLFGGSHARQSVSEASGLVKLKGESESLSLATASYGVLGAVGWEGIARMKLEPGKVLLVFGLGMLGLLAGRVAQSLGVRVVGVNRSAWKRDVAKEFGFDAVAAPEAGEIQKAVGALGGGDAVLAYDTTGSQEVLDLALASLGTGGELSLGGYYPGKYAIDYDLCHGKNLRIHNPVGPGSYLGKFTGLVEGGLDADALIRTRVKPEGVAAFYAELIGDHSKFLGAVIEW
ncbi:MAG: zinc-binding dehydrogenase, partial [Chthoniobacteraceae bacterium]